MMPPYTDDTLFYASKRTRKIVPVNVIRKGKGWYEYHVGPYTGKSREHGTYLNVLSKYYPDYKSVSLFSETSYHSGYDKKGRITSYGTHDYTLDYSSYKSLGRYTLIRPVRTQRKSMCGKTINYIDLLEWNYIVIDWIPEKNIKLQIKHTVHTPFDDKKTIYKSKKYKMSEKDDAIRDFKEYVRKQQGQPRVGKYADFWNIKDGY